MTWDEFEKRASAAIGQSRGWKRIFAEQAGIPDCVVLQRWKKKGQVPQSAVDALPLLRHEPVASVRQRWTAEEMERIAELARPDETGAFIPDTEIRDLLTEELGRKVTLGNVKRAKMNLRRGIQAKGQTIERPDKQRRRSDDEYPEERIFRDISELVNEKGSDKYLYASR